MKTMNIVSSLALVAGLLTAGVAEASISVAGEIVQLFTPPASVVEDQLESSSHMFVFNERRDHLVTTDIDIDVVDTGFLGNVVGPWTPQGQIDAGTRINSYFVHSDKHNGDPTQDFDAKITFGGSEEILGVYFTRDGLDTWVTFGSVTTTYDVNQVFNATGNDYFILAADRKSIDVHSRIGGGSDQLRIITTVPEPSSLGLLGLGLFGIYKLRRRRRVV